MLGRRGMESLERGAYAINFHVTKKGGRGGPKMKRLMGHWVELEVETVVSIWRAWEQRQILVGEYEECWCPRGDYESLESRSYGGPGRGRGTDAVKGAGWPNRGTSFPEEEVKG